MKRYWQITLIVCDDAPQTDLRLTKELIEHGYRINPQPQYLKLVDVEAMEIGLKPLRIFPLPSDFGDKSGD